MKSFIFLLLITYTFTGEPSTITLDLKASQTLRVGTAGTVIVQVTANDAMSLSALSNLVLKTTTGETTIVLTCTIASAIDCTANTAADVTCNAAAPTTAGTYKLAPADTTISMTATYDVEGTATPVSTTPSLPGAVTLTVEASSPPPPNSPPTTITIDLKTSQTLTVGTAGTVIVQVTADNAMSLSTLSNLVLKSTTGETTIVLTCNIDSAINCVANTAADVTCNAAAPTTADTYKLVVAADKTISMTATYDNSGTATPVSTTPSLPGAVTLTVEASSPPPPPNSPPTTVTLDLKASQTLTLGTAGTVIIKVTANNAMSLSTLSNLVLKPTTGETTIALTCSFTTPVSCTANTAKEVTCNAAAPTTAGTYKLAVAADKTISMTATYNNGSGDVAVPSNVIPTVATSSTSLTVSTASNNDNTNTNTNTNADSENDNDNSSFLKFSYIIFFIAFLF